jgi:hypothetical protein
MLNVLAMRISAAYQFKDIVFRAFFGERRILCFFLVRLGFSFGFGAPRFFRESSR